MVNVRTARHQQCVCMLSSKQLHNGVYLETRDALFRQLPCYYRDNVRTHAWFRIVFRSVSIYCGFSFHHEWSFISLVAGYDCFSLVTSSCNKSPLFHYLLRSPLASKQATLSYTWVFFFHPHCRFPFIHHTTHHKAWKGSKGGILLNRHVNEGLSSPLC